MTEKPPDEAVVVRCPKCNAKVLVDDKAKTKMIATCPNGHEIPLVKMV
jgi:DNA-directed RNA polymerase subunit RPC12/RpoP